MDACLKTPGPVEDGQRPFLRHPRLRVGCTVSPLLHLPAGSMRHHSRHAMLSRLCCTAVQGMRFHTRCCSSMHHRILRRTSMRHHTRHAVPLHLTSCRTSMQGPCASMPRSPASTATWPASAPSQRHSGALPSSPWRASSRSTAAPGWRAGRLRCCLRCPTTPPSPSTACPQSRWAQESALVAGGPPGTGIEQVGTRECFGCMLVACWLHVGCRGATWFRDRALLG